jgi:hypothetical protein
VCGAPDNSPIYDHIDNGPRWRTWLRMIDVQRVSWFGYGGAWGEVGLSAETTGPLGPSRYKNAAPEEWR